MLWLNVINYAPETQDSLGTGGSPAEDTGLRRCEYIERLHCPPQSDVKVRPGEQAVSTNLAHLLSKLDLICVNSLKLKVQPQMK